MTTGPVRLEPSCATTTVVTLRSPGSLDAAMLTTLPTGWCGLMAAMAATSGSPSLTVTPTGSTIA